MSAIPAEFGDGARPTNQRSKGKIFGGIDLARLGVVWVKPVAEG